MAPQELQLELQLEKAICEDLFQKYATFDPASSATRKSAAQQQRRFSIIGWASFARDNTSLNCDQVRAVVIKQLVAIRDNLEFAALHDPEFSDKSDVLPLLEDTQRRQWIQQLEGTPFEALEAVESIIDRLIELSKAIRQDTSSEVPTNTPDAATGEVVSKTNEAIHFPTMEKRADRKKAHISSQGSVPSQQTSSYDERVDMGNALDRNSNLSTLAKARSPQSYYDRPGSETIHEQTTHPNSLLSRHEQAQSLKTMVDIGKAHFHRRQYQEAEEEYRKILQQHSKFMEANKPSIILVKGNLANALAKQDKHREAEALYKEMWSLSTDIHGKEHLQTLACESNLASMLEERGEHEEAVKNYRNILALREKTDHSSLETLSSSNKLANALMRLKEFGEATDMYKATLKAHRDARREEHPNTIITLGNLANSLQNQGQLEEAKEKYLEAMELGSRVLDAEHPFLDWIGIRRKEEMEDNGE
ncbi:kinesin light chain [Fusarium austroafricanum]|uniref:Kinesin light chain n=1 Tax=Fusarium austroafricanum TaxID=2364996 RepID=A0A8H4KHY1_9HYPO|nr:kinesin light chain [Fusarium austroafricanum]